MGGLNHLTELVVDELSILPASVDHMNFHWPSDTRTNKTIFVFSSIYEKWKDKIPSHLKVFTGDLEDAQKILHSEDFLNKIPRFDIVLVGRPDEIGKAIRPKIGEETSLVRPRSVILVDSDNESSWTGETKETRAFFQSGKMIRSSRCGDFHYALKLLKENPEVMKALEENMISHNYNFTQLSEAYSKAKEPSSVKVVVNFD